MSTTSYGRSRSGDRFYNPPQVRRQRQLQQQQELQQQQQQEEVVVAQKQKQEKDEIIYKKEKTLINNSSNNNNNNYNSNNNNNNNYSYNQPQQQQQVRRQKAAVGVVAVEQKGKSCSSSSENRVESDDCASTATTPATSVSSNSTNLDRFLEYTTPFVPAQYFSKTSMKGWRTQEDEFRPYFMLGDLWESFKEWSAYGAGVPLLLNGSDSVVQYYVPYLSGIQLYIDPSKPFPRTRMPGEESDESARETSSDGSSDYEAERGAFCVGSWNQPDVAESTLQGMKGLSLRSKPFNGSSSDEGEASSSPGVLTFEYFEHSPPYSREPLADKIALLATRFPELRTYRSCDLSPSSWISVAWYPIYRIPTGPTLQNLDSCFLTFHCLSAPVRGGQTEWQSHNGSCPRENANGFNLGIKIPLPIFGLASYKFKISVWDQNGVDECQKAKKKKKKSKMENITASEVAGFGVGTFLLCATIAAPKVDALISSSQRSSLKMCKKCGDVKLIACKKCKGSGLVKTGGLFGLGNPMDDLFLGRFESDEKPVSCVSCGAKGHFPCPQCNQVSASSSDKS